MTDSKPEYKFIEEEGQEELSPIKRKIAKTMEVTETFNVYDAMSYVGKIDKAIADKQAEIDGLVSMKEAYEKELKLIEDKLGVQKLEEEYQKSLAKSDSQE